MIKINNNPKLNKNNKLTPFITFNRDEWSQLRNSVPLQLTEQDLQPLIGFNEELSLEDVKTIYLPLTRLVNYFIEANIKRQTILHEFLGVKPSPVPYIIGIAGSVSVGKSTSARILQSLLSNWPNKRKVDLITTDGFLYPLSILKEKNILDKKGFPQSYDIKKLMQFVADIKSGKPKVKAPIYSHLIYDIIPDAFDIIDQPDILILEGLNVLHTEVHHKYSFVSDFIDFSIYVDASEELLKEWYISRFLKFRHSAFADPNSYFHKFSSLNLNEATKLATSIWDEINGKNLHENILPTRERANLILEKGKNHTIEQVMLRK